jgi:hypothetical protein
MLTEAGILVLLYVIGPIYIALRVAATLIVVLTVVVALLLYAVATQVVAPLRRRSRRDT